MRLRSVLCATVLATIAAPPARPQGLTGPAVLYARPGRTELATVAEGTTLDPARTSGGFALVVVRGYVATKLLGGARDSFPASVGATEVRMREAPSTSAPVVAELRQGMAFHVLKRVGRWTEVERAGWIRRSAFPAVLAGRRVSTQPKPARPERPAPQPSAPPAAMPPQTSAPATTPPPAAQDTTPDNAEAVTPDSVASLSPAPGVAPVATIRHGAVLVPIARDRGWVRVRLEGWVREQDVEAADSTLAMLSAADLRASPQRYVGRTVRWTVTALAFQTADPMHKDLRPDEPYVLARGPGKETALLYLALPPQLVDRAKALSPMTPVVITAKVRTGRSNPSGVPILDVLTLATK
jgi:Bacterial SH3 domain